MNTEVKTPVTNDADKAANAKKLSEQIETELTEQQNALKALHVSSGKIGALGLEQLATKLGESTNQSGRPSLAAFMAFTYAILATGASYAVQNRLAAMANKSVSHFKKNDPSRRVEVCKQKAKGEHGGASCSYRVNKPVAWDIAIGE